MAEAVDRISTNDCRYRSETDIDGFWRVLHLLRLNRSDMGGQRSAAMHKAIIVC
jgi:hypothetical protein